MENKDDVSTYSKENTEFDAFLCDEVKKSIETIILYRSLYILKKKFELKKTKIRALYNSFNIDKNSNVMLYNSYQVNIENFVVICETIFKDCNILLTTLTNPKDIFLSNIFLNLKRKMNEMNGILNDIKLYITDENNSLVKKYNALFYEKKIKPNLIKNILEIKQNKYNRKISMYNNKSSYINDYHTNKTDNEKIILNIIEKERQMEKEVQEVKEKNNNYEDEEIHRAIVEYNRKGKIIKTFNRLVNDNLTLSVNKDNERRKKERIINKERIKYFQINNNNDFIGSYMQNIVENKNNFDIINENEEEYNYENDEKNKTISMYNLINIEKDQNYNNILYIETLPLIIADYMQQFPFYCIIETENDLTDELNLLFDKELIQKMNKYEEVLKQKNENFITRELHKFEINKLKNEKNIKIYENLITEKKIKGENTVFLENMLEKLLAKNIVIQEKISHLRTENNNYKLRYDTNSKNELQDMNNISKYSNIGHKLSESNNTSNYNEFNKIRGNEKLTISQLTTNFKQENGIKNTQKSNTNIITDRTNDNTKILKSIKDIFSFYSRQHNSVGSNGLFADVEKNMVHLTSSEFYRFCMEFSIPITRQKSVEMYKKSIIPSSEDKTRLMNFDAFKYSLKIIANDIHQNKLNLLLNNIKQEKRKVNSIEEKKNKMKEIEKYNNIYNINNISNNNINKNKSIKEEFYFETEKRKLMNSIFSSENKYNNEKNKTEEEIMSNFFTYIGINKKNEYKSKLKGFLLPFRTREKKQSLTNSKHGIGSKLELEMKEANKIYVMQKNEKKKIFFSKEALEKQKHFKEKKKMFKLKNEQLINHLEKRYNKKYADQLMDFKKKIQKQKLEIENMKNKEEFEKKNLISWNKLEDFDISNLDIDENEKKVLIDSDNSDEEIINQISNENRTIINNNNYRKKINKNYSAIELVSEMDSIVKKTKNKKVKRLKS